MSSSDLSELGKDLVMGVMNDLFDLIEHEQSKPEPDQAKLTELNRQHMAAADIYFERN